MTFNIIGRARERTTQFKSISFKTNNLKNTEKKPAGLGLRNLLFTDLYVTFVVFFLVRKQRLRKLDLIHKKTWGSFRDFFIFDPKYESLHFYHSISQLWIALRYRNLLRICRSFFKRLLFLHYQVILAATSDFPTGFVFVLCSMVWE